MSFRFINVKRYKRGAHWPDGEVRMCVRCGYENRRRRAQAVVTADLLRGGSRLQLPVGYCRKHVPEEVIELRGGGSDGERPKTTEPTPQSDARRSQRLGRLV